MAQEKRLTPIKITDKKADKVYELDFNRDAIRFAEMKGFKRDDVLDYPETKFPELFYYAFRFHHREMSKQQTDVLYERLEGYSTEFIQRLLALYDQASLANNIVDSTEEMGKNNGLTVEL